MVSRRTLLSLSAWGGGLSACGGRTDPGQQGGSVAAAAPGTLTAGAGAKAANTLVVVFQRFAADWINMLIPAGDDSYAAQRPAVRINDPLPLNAYYGLHPALQPLQELYQQGSLGFVTATGWTPLDARDRSHFYAQTLAESGARAGVHDGWLSRVMQHDAQASGLWATIAAEPSVPQSFQGHPDAIALQNFAAYTHGSVMAEQATQLVEGLAQLSGAPGGTTLRLAQSMRSIETDPPATSATVYPATELGNGLKTAAEAIRGGLAPRVITVSSNDDWDTHVNQLSRHQAALPNFANAIRAFHDDLGELMSNVTLVTMTEFGRKAVDNFSGTDHGTAASMLVMGGAVAGGQVYGQWPGMHDSALFEGEDLEVTTDYRSVLGEILGHHLGASDSALESIFPGGFAQRSHWRNFMIQS